jgi:hypothetical protein
MVAPITGSGEVCVWLDYGDRLSVLCWHAWQECGFSRREDVFAFLLLYKDILCYFSMRFPNIILQYIILTTVQLIKVHSRQL